MPQTDFTPSFSFSLPDESLRKLNRSAFLTGTTPGPEYTRAVIEGSLDPLAKLASEREKYARQFALEQRALDLEEKNLANLNAYRSASLALDYDRLRFQEKQAKLGLISSIGQGIGLLAFMPGRKTNITYNKAGQIASVHTPSVLSSISTGAINIFKSIWGIP